MTDCPYKKRVAAVVNVPVAPILTNGEKPKRPRDKVNKITSVIGTNEFGEERVFKSAAAASREMGKSKGAVGNAIAQNTKVCGMTWRYLG